VPLRVAVAICLATQVTGLLLVLSAGSAPMLILAVAVFGLGYGGLMPLNGLLIGAFYGRWLFGRMLGLTQPMMLPFQFLGLPLASWIFDRTGSYRAALLIFIGMYALAGLLLSGLRPPEEAPDAPA
jgi:MFS family permease